MHRYEHPAYNTAHEKERDILVIVPWLQGGGGQSALIGLLNQLPAERIRLVVLFVGSRNAGPVLDLVGEHIFLERRRTPIGILSARRALSRYIRSARSVYSLMRASHLVLGVGPLGGLRRKRFAATFHQLPSEDSGSMKSAAEDILVRRAIRAADLVTSPSLRAINELAQRKIATMSRLRYEANVVNATSDGALPARVGHLQEIRLVFAGRLSDQKGLDRLPEILRNITTPVLLRIVGEGELSAYAESMQRDTAAPHRVKYLGHSSDVAGHIDWADAVVLPSRWELNPMVIWEAWARGRPVISSDLPVFGDLATAGPIWPCADTADFVATIGDRLLDHETRSAAFSQGIQAFSDHRQERRYIAEFLAS